MLKSLNFLHVFTGKKHVTAQRACRTILANTHILSQNYELFFFKYQSILNFSSLFCASVITIVLGPLQTIEGPLCLCPRFKMFACHKIGGNTGHRIQSHFYTISPRDHRHQTAALGMRIYVL